MYGKIIDLMDDENFYKVPKFLEIAEISPLALYLFSRMLDQYRYHVRHSDNPAHRDMLALGWFWWTFPDIEKHVGLKKDQARACLKELETVMLVEKTTKRIGMEQRCWYRMNEDKIEFYLEKYRIARRESRDRELELLPRTADFTTTDSGNPASNQALSNQALSNQEKDMQADKTPACGPTPLGYFLDTYKAIKGVAWVGNRDIAGKKLKELLKQITVDEYREILPRYFAMTDKWVVDHGYDVARLVEKINVLRCPAPVAPKDLPLRFVKKKDGKHYILNNDDDNYPYPFEAYERIRKQQEEADHKEYPIEEI